MMEYLTVFQRSHPLTDIAAKGEIKLKLTDQKLTQKSELINSQHTGLPTRGRHESPAHFFSRLREETTTKPTDLGLMGLR
jgi:hypothetical protein